MGFVAKAIPGSHMQTSGPWKGRYPFLAAVLQGDQTWNICGYNGANLPGGANVFGVSVVKLGHLNGPIVSADVIGNWLTSKKILFLAEDGGTFLYEPTVKYG